MPKCAAYICASPDFSRRQSLHAGERPILHTVAAGPLDDVPILLQVYMLTLASRGSSHLA